MNYQLKLFTNVDATKIEAKVNEWIESVHPRIISEPCMCANAKTGVWCCSIWYDPTPTVK